MQLDALIRKRRMSQADKEGAGMQTADGCPVFAKSAST
jgi:hypothetical protein